MSSFGNELFIPVSGWSGRVSKRSCRLWCRRQSDWRYFPMPRRCSSRPTPAPSSLWLESHSNASMAQTPWPLGCLQLVLAKYSSSAWFSKREPLKFYSPFLFLVNLHLWGSKHTSNTHLGKVTPRTLKSGGVRLLILVMGCVWWLRGCVADSQCKCDYVMYWPEWQGSWEDSESQNRLLARLWVKWKTIYLPFCLYWSL